MIEPNIGFDVYYCYFLLNLYLIKGTSTCLFLDPDKLKHINSTQKK